MCSCLREDEDENDDNNDNDDDDDLCPRVQLGAGSDCSAACPGQAAKSELKKTIAMEHMCMHLHHAGARMLTWMDPWIHGCMHVCMFQKW